MIQIVTGKLGAGKTLYSVGLILDALCLGRYVITNIKVEWDNLCEEALLSRRVVLDPRQLIRVDPIRDKNWQRSIVFGTPSGFVEAFFDEIHLGYNARDWAQTAADAREMISFLSQSRKARVNITFIAQEEDTIDKQMKLQAQWLIYICNSSQIPLGPLGKMPFNFFIVVKRDPKNNNVLSRTWKAYNKRHFRLYDSFSFLDDVMIELSASVPHVDPLKLPRIPLHVWLWRQFCLTFHPLRPLFRSLRQTPKKPSPCASSSSSLS